MEEKQDFLTADGDSDATLVTPRFDEVEAETARPVVPFADVPPVEGDIADAPVYAAHAGAPVYAANPPQRRSWTLALVIISALVGTVLGGAGLRLYQQRQRAAAATAAQPATPAQVESAQPSPAQQIVEEHQTAALPAPATVVEDPGDPEVVTASTSRRDDDAADDERRDDSAKSPKPSDRERDDESKEKNDDDERAAKPDKEKAPRARRVDVLTGPPQAVGVPVGQSEEAEPEPRPIERDRDEIFNERRQRRQERRERRARQRDVDRVRGIFEGQP